MAKSTTDSAFKDDVLNADKPVLVDFWAEWCGPCRQLSPIIDEIATERGNAIEVYKVNIDQNPETPTSFGVRGIPTLMLFHKGKPIATKVGALPKQSLNQWLDAELA